MILRNHAAQSNTAKGIHMLKSRFQAVATAIFKIDINAIREIAAELIDK
jgi:hypothetical protein